MPPSVLALRFRGSTKRDHASIFNDFLSQPMLSIGAATREDLPSIAALIRGLAVYEQLEHLCIVREADLADVLFADNPTVEVVLARVDEDIAGFALFFHNFSTFLGKRGLYLEDLFVLEQYRRRGCGKALLVHLARLAVERGCGRFEWSVLDWNNSAITFYKSLGAQVLPDWRITRVTGDALQLLAGSDATAR